MAFAILSGDKRIENRAYKIGPGWIGLHTGESTSPPEAVRSLLSNIIDIPAEVDLPHSAIVGAFCIDRTVDVNEIEDSWASGPKCSIISSTVRIAKPVTAKGALHLWDISSDILEKVQRRLAKGEVRKNQPVTVMRRRQVRKHSTGQHT